MTDAEKEAREIVKGILASTGGESFPAYPVGAHTQRILRFAREYGHRQDQLVAAFRETASGVYAFYAALLAEGFTTEQAFTMAGVYLTAMLSRPSEPEKK